MMLSRPLHPEWHTWFICLFFGLVGTLAGLLFILPIYWLML